VGCFGFVADLAVPAAIGHLEAKDNPDDLDKAGVLRGEIGADPEPETEVAEIHVGFEDGIGGFLVFGNEVIGEVVEGVLEAWGGFGDADIYELEDDPGGVCPAALAPGAVGVLVGEEVGAPSFGGGFGAFWFVCLGWFIEEVAHRLPADGGVTMEEPFDGLIGDLHYLFADESPEGDFLAIFLGEQFAIADFIGEGHVSAGICEIDCIGGF